MTVFGIAGVVLVLIKGGNPFWLWRYGQNLLVARNAPEREQSLVLFTAQQGCLNLADGPGGQSSSSLFFKEAAGPESSEEFGILVDDRCIDTGVFQPRYLVHEPYHPDSSRLVLHSCSGPMQDGPSPSRPDGGGRFSSGLGTNSKSGHGATFFSAHSSRLPLSTEPERSDLADHSHAMEKKEVLDGRCFMPLGLQSHSAAR